MNSRSGSSPREMAVDIEIWWCCSGSQASFLIALIVGDITNSVRNSAIPTSTWLGGVLFVPIAERMKPSTIRIRVNPVTVNRIAGISDSPPIENEDLKRV